MPNVMGGSGRTSFGAGHGDRMSAGRAAGGGRSGRTGGSGPNAPGGNQYAGYKGPVGTRAPTPDAPGSYGLSGAETRAYNAAKTEYQNRSFGKRLLDTLSPLKSIDPQINQPSSYAAGQYHHGFNPGEVAGGLLGSIFPGGGAVLGKIGGFGWEQSGMHDAVVTGPGSGFSTSFPDGGPGYNSSTGFAGPGGNPAAPQGKGSQSGGSLLQNLAQINQPVSGNPGAPQAVGPTPSAPTPQPNYQQIMASLQQITPGYGVQLPGYQYRKATV
jgi:hypothetical protein